MTWSIIARDASGAFGVAIASRFFAVGADQMQLSLVAAFVARRELLDDPRRRPLLAKAVQCRRGI